MLRKIRALRHQASTLGRYTTVNHRFTPQPPPLLPNTLHPQASFQRAIRGEPNDAELWEGLGAAYQALSRHSSALKAYGRALELDGTRLYCLLQSGVLQYQMGGAYCNTQLWNLRSMCSGLT